MSDDRIPSLPPSERGSYKPDRKVVSAAVATVLVYLVSALTSLDIPVGVEGAVAVITAYLIPN